MNCRANNASAVVITIAPILISFKLTIIREEPAARTTNLSVLSNTDSYVPVVLDLALFFNTFYALRLMNAGHKLLLHR
jgi:hypothetical protein